MATAAMRIAKSVLTMNMLIGYMINEDGQMDRQGKFVHVKFFRASERLEFIFK